jgi:hypothetical protein
VLSCRYCSAAKTTWFVTVTLNNLTIGQDYQLQVWANDSRLNNLGQNNPDLFVTFTDDTTSVDAQNNVNNILGGIGQYVIGTFTADAASQVFTYTGGNAPGVDIDTTSCTAILNAYQLRVVPEPSAMALAALGIAGLLILRRRV